MEHYAPHPSARFEGYYSKFHLPSGSTLIIIICSTRKARRNPHIVSINYVPADVTQAYQKDIWVSDIVMQPISSGGFELIIPGLGYMKCSRDSAVQFNLESPDIQFSATTTSPPQPWLRGQNTPAGLLTYLPLPIQWHVQSRHSTCDFSLSLPGATSLHLKDTHGTASVHLEKNWGESFPRSHIWIQAFDTPSTSNSSNSTAADTSAQTKGPRGFALAGGTVWFLSAYLLGLTTPSLSLGFKPPFSMGIPSLGIAPFLSTSIDWPRRAVHITVSDFSKKIVVRANAPEGTFLGINAPFEEGFKENWLGESFQSELVVEVFRRVWTWGCWGWRWRRVAVERFENAALEFGGDAYPRRGAQERIS